MADPNAPTPYDPTGQSQQASNVQQLYAADPNNPANFGAPADPGNPNAPANPTPQGPQPVITDPSGSGLKGVQVIVNNQVVNIWLPDGINIDTLLKIQTTKAAQQTAAHTPLDRKLPIDQDTVLNQIQSIQGWYGNLTMRKQIIQQMFDAGLLTSTKNPSAAEVASAWGLLVEEAAFQQMGKGTLGAITPQDLLAKAAAGGWNAINPTLSATDAGLRGTGNFRGSADTTSETVYKSYLDPATVMGTLADSYFRLVGRNPTPTEYNAFLQTIYGYQEAENTGKLDKKSTVPSSGAGLIDPSTGQPVAPSDSSGAVTQTNVVSQRGIGLRGLQFMAGQSAMANPEEGAYQAATTYFNAFIKALSGPAAGMQASGPTTTVP